MLELSKGKYANMRKGANALTALFVSSSFMPVNLFPHEDY